MDWVQILVDGSRAAIGVPAIAYALAVIGLNVHFGYTGLFNIGHVAFLAAGAYGAGITATEFDFPFPLAILAGTVAAAGLGLLLGIPTLRLRAEYLAVVTISAGEILRLVVRSSSFESVTGGPQGIGRWATPFYDANPIPEGGYGIGRLEFSERQLWVMLVGWILVALAVLVTFLLIRSPWGRALRSIREDEDAARSLGKNVFAFKLQSLVLGGVIGSLAGLVLAVDANFTDPTLYQTVFTFFMYTALILGGTARILGPVIGAMAFWFTMQALDSFLRQAITPGAFAGDVIDQTDLGPLRLALVGLALVLLVVFRPQGILGGGSDGGMR
ncbi:MAG: branched-chain amino acid ABC transporter permease [Acidimicrobiales bacterium]|nr:branched-chain amino acid ABC transporter permease [Acidimicrobiales bacterium]